MSESPRTLDIHVTPKAARRLPTDRLSRFGRAMERFSRWYDAASVAAVALLAAVAAAEGKLLLSLVVFAVTAVSYALQLAWRRGR